ncbi:hypothetical protein J2T57_001692 [Natronocella acetinitrilica]|uniref:Uncharacterized protein n=1 Tax=Natronocella acetinitrilica TaxID=414046 RepID=A0AAE3G2F9_9GAMM|nr:hypothetical protein [Natronocella acetinitrilica]MCP1674590.1 hypothetical protein [Natronocella acetinitrilica]
MKGRQTMTSNWTGSAPTTDGLMLELRRAGIRAGSAKDIVPAMALGCALQKGMLLLDAARDLFERAGSGIASCVRMPGSSTFDLHSWLAEAEMMRLVTDTTINPPGQSWQTLPRSLGEVIERLAASGLLIDVNAATMRAQDAGRALWQLQAMLKSCCELIERALINSGEMIANTDAAQAWLSEWLADAQALYTMIDSRYPASHPASFQRLSGSTLN